MEKKGFTLVELLAVIVILAIIALIATPLILNVIDNAQKGTAKSSTLGYLDAIELYITKNELNNKNNEKIKPNIQYYLTRPTTVDGKAVSALNDLIEIKGNKPTGLEDYIVFDDKYIVKESNITIGGYKIEIEDGKIKTVVKGEKIKVESISLSSDESTMERGSSTTLEVTFNPENASNQRLKYKSSDSSIVTVDEKGKIKGIKNGEATITVISDDDENIKAEIKITVISPSAVTGLRIEKQNESESLYRTGSLQLVGVLEPSDATSNALTWTSSDESIATVTDSGIVKGISLGDVTIKAVSQSGIEATIDLTVEEPPYTGITSKDYTVGETVSYAGKTWQVIKDNGDNTTMILKTNYTTGAFGSTTEFTAGNNAYDKVNTDFVNATSALKSDIELGGIVLDSNSNSYVRLPLYSEISSSITNGSSTPYWTMTPYNSSNMYYSLYSGGKSYTYYSGSGYTKRYYGVSTYQSLVYDYLYSSYSRTSYTTYVSPSSTIGYTSGSASSRYSSPEVSSVSCTSSSSYSSTYVDASYTLTYYCDRYSGAEIRYYKSGDSTCYFGLYIDCTNDYYYVNSYGSSNMGIRPVITVREK